MLHHLDPLKSDFTDAILMRERRFSMKHGYNNRDSMLAFHGVEHHS